MLISVSLQASISAVSCGRRDPAMAIEMAVRTWDGVANEVQEFLASRLQRKRGRRLEIVRDVPAKLVDYGDHRDQKAFGLPSATACCCLWQLFLAA